jgi:hypothetical protein
MNSYDEESLRTRLAGLDRMQKTAFAAACAERLWPLFVRYAERAAGDVAPLESVLQDTWRAAQGDGGDLASAQEIAEEMIPSEDDDGWVHEMGYGQSAVAGIAYAVRTWLTDDPQEAVWAARQVYEAADYAAQHALPELDLNAAGAEQQFHESAFVQEALSALGEDLSAVESTEDSKWEDLRQRARSEGKVWAASLP